jgi:hypothetical protein
VTVSVRVKKKALVDDRDKVQILSDLAGYNAFEALGRLVHLWDKCVSTGQDTLTDRQVEAFLGTGSAAAFITSGLAERVSDGIRVCGAREEIEARNRQTSQRRAAGFASVASRTIEQRPVNAPLTSRQRIANEPLTDSSSDLFSSLSGASSSEPPEDLKPGRGTKRQMPASFAPTQDHIEYAAANRVDLALEISKCRDWHLANGRMRSDWNATFRNWLREAVSRRAERGFAPRAVGFVDRKKALT